MLLIKRALGLVDHWAQRKLKLLMIITLVIFVLCFIAGIASHLSFWLIGSYVADDGMLVEPFALLPIGFIFYFLGIWIGLGLLLLVAVDAPGFRFFAASAWGTFLALVALALWMGIDLLIHFWFGWVPEHFPRLPEHFSKLGGL